MPRVRTSEAALAGLSASLAGIGLARFAYALLIPALIAAHGFAPALAADLLTGYSAAARAASGPSAT